MTTHEAEEALAVLAGAPYWWSVEGESVRAHSVNSRVTLFGTPPVIEVVVHRLRQHACGSAHVTWLSRPSRGAGWSGSGQVRVTLVGVPAIERKRWLRQALGGPSSQMLRL